MKSLAQEARKMFDQISLADHENSENVQKLPGDASTRMYYRLHISGKSYVLMKMESFEEHGLRLPFIEVQSHLKNAGVDVPQVIDFDAARGFILLEDLGDVTLLRKLQDVSSQDVERHLYERVIDSLVDLQANASPRDEKNKIAAFGLHFDETKLLWEIQFTVEHFYSIYLKRRISDEDMAVIQSGFREICATLAAQPKVLTHRDFHSRNIMVFGERFVMIDFQDARMGPREYDLVSLLKDSYYQLDDAQISRLSDYYIARWEGVTGQKIDRQKFREIYDLMAVQRNFKAIGSFASFLNRRGNATYLKFIGNTFENIRKSLLRYPKYARLREVLFHYYYF